MDRPRWHPILTLARRLGRRLLLGVVTLLLLSAFLLWGMVSSSVPGSCDMGPHCGDVRTYWNPETDSLIRVIVTPTPLAH